MHLNRMKLNLHKYKTAGVSQYNIDQMSDDDELDDQSSISDIEFSDVGSESESFPDTESTGPSEATTDDFQWDKKMRAPVLGVAAQSRRMSLDVKSLSSHRALLQNQRNQYKSYEDVSNVDQDDSSLLYSKIERKDNREYRNHFRIPRQPKTTKKNKLTMIEELSPIRPESVSTTSEVPPMPLSLRCKSEWNPQLTSTTTSIQPLMPLPLLPKTNPHVGYKMMSSTPRTAQIQKRYQKRTNYHNYYGMGTERTESLTGESDDLESPVPWNSRAMPKPNPHSQYSTGNAVCRPENYGVPSALAKNLGINGIVFLNMALSGKRLTVNILKGFYFTDASQSNICSYLRAELRHRSRSHSNPKRHCSSSDGRHSRYEETYRTRLVANTNRPNFQETFHFTLSENCGRDSLVLSVYSMEADETQRKKVLGCMAFPISRLLKKARQVNSDYFYYQENSENLEEVEINDGGYFLLDPKYGEKRNLPQSKVKRQTFYNDPTLSGTTSGSSFNSQVQMTGASSRLSVPNEMTMGDYYCSSSDLRLRSNPTHHLDYTSASSSTNGSSAVVSEGKHKFHRVTLPSITTTSDNTSDDTSSPRSNEKVDQHFLYPENGGVYGAGPVREESPKKTSAASVRRAASFTFSPKASTAKNNQRPILLRDNDEKEKRKFLGPLSKTISYLRNKMDTALSTSSLYPSREEVRQWETSFETLLNSKFGCALFRQFLKKEFSDENVDFWLECEEFKKMKDGKKSTTQKAMEIYKEFVAEHAPKEVNLDSDTRAATKAALENGCKNDTFSLAQNRVEQLMSKDSYRRFLRDRLFLDLVESYENGEKDKEAVVPPKEK